MLHWKLLMSLSTNICLLLDGQKCFKILCEPNVTDLYLQNSKMESIRASNKMPKHLNQGATVGISVGHKALLR